MHMISSIASEVSEFFFRNAANEIKRDGNISTTSLAKIMIGLGNTHITFNKNNFIDHHITRKGIMVYKNSLTGERIVEPVSLPSEHLTKVIKTKLLKAVNSSYLASDLQKSNQRLSIKIKKINTAKKLRRSTRLANRTTDAMQRINEACSCSHKQSNTKRVNANANTGLRLDISGGEVSIPPDIGARINQHIVASQTVMQSDD